MSEFIGETVAIHMDNDMNVIYDCTFVDFNDAGIIVDFKDGDRGFIPYSAFVMLAKAGAK